MSSVVRLSWRKGRRMHDTVDPDIILSHDFESVYQPIFCPTQQKLVGYEALVRVKRNGTPISPVSLFELAASQDQVFELDSHLLQRHLEHFGGKSLPVWLFLNITPQTCTQPTASLERLASHCRRCGIPPERIVLELVEAASDNTDALLDFIHRAREQGFQIAIDDFGMGDSNFERLWRINPLIVKLDRSLLVNAEHHIRARMLLESLVRMIRESGSLVLLEGIENEALARIALATEADLLQGFLFGRPGPVSKKAAEQAEARLAQRVSQSSEWSLQDSRDQENYLRLLRFEIMETCHLVARGVPFRAACEQLLQMDGVKRCFVLDQNGIQQGNLARTHPDIKQVRFNPLYESAGACWAHREYFQKARQRPQHIHCSRPYVGLPDARRTVTLSTVLHFQEQTQVLCVDIHPDEVFGGQLAFPDTL